MKLKMMRYLVAVEYIKTSRGGESDDTIEKHRPPLELDASCYTHKHFRQWIYTQKKCCWIIG